MKKMGVDIQRPLFLFRISKRGFNNCETGLLTQ